MGGRFQEPRREEGKRIRAHEAPTQSTQQMRPKFCLEHLRKAYCLSNCTPEEKAAFADRIYELSQLSWQQIMQSHRHGQGSETLPRDAIKGDKIPDVITEDVTIIAFRFNGKAPMVGFRSGEVFHVVWLDRSFTLYKH